MQIIRREVRPKIRPVSVDRAKLHEPVGEKQLLSLPNVVARENRLALIAHHRAGHRRMVGVNAIGKIPENREADEEGH